MNPKWNWQKAAELLVPAAALLVLQAIPIAAHRVPVAEPAHPAQELVAAAMLPAVLLLRAAPRALRVRLKLLPSPAAARVGLPVTGAQPAVAATTADAKIP